MRHLILLFAFFIFSYSAIAQETVQGILKNLETNKPVEYVIVVANNSGKTTVSNSEGRYQIQTTKEDTKLLFKHLDFFTKELDIKSQKTSTIFLQPSTESLEEIVILSIPLRDELMKAIKTSQNNFSNNIKVNTYYRELMYINDGMYLFEDAEIDYYVQSINKTDIIVKNSRSVKFTNDSAKKFDSLSKVTYYWGDLTTNISDEFDFRLVKNVINSKEYEMYITRKVTADGVELNVLNFAPIDNAKNATLKGTVVYGKDDYLIREIKAELDPKFKINSKFEQQQSNHRFKTSFRNKTTLFNIHNNKYTLAYNSVRIFGVSNVLNQVTKVGGVVELLVDHIDDKFPKPNKNDFFTRMKLTPLGKNYKTKFWEKFNSVPLIQSEEQMLKQISK